MNTALTPTEALALLRPRAEARHATYAARMAAYTLQRELARHMDAGAYLDPARAAAIADALNAITDSIRSK